MSKTQPSSTSVLWSKNFILAFISNLSLFFSFYLLVPILPFYVIDELGVAGAEAGIILALYTIAALLIRPFSGFLVDYFARKPLYLLCFLIFTVIFAGYIAATFTLLFIIMRILHGFTFGVGTVAGNTLAIDIMPSDRRGEGIGFFGMSTNIAMAIGPMVGLLLIEKYSFPFIFATSCGISCIGLLAICFIKTPAKPRIIQQEPLSLDRFILVNAFRPAWVFFAFAIGYGVITNYIGVYSKQINLGSSAGLFFTLQASGIILARFLSSRMLNRGELARVVYLGTGFLTIAFLLIICSSTFVPFLICALLMGIGYGYITPAFQTMFINLAEHNRRGTANSTYFTFWDFGIGVGIALGGYMIEHYDFTMLFGICWIAILTGTIYFIRYAAPHYLRYKLR
ncbi:MAG: MFS transporter [Bacteroidales bacterium]